MPKQDLELLKAQGLGTPTDLCFQHLLQRIINRTREYGEREQIGLVFDDEPTEGERYYALFNHYQAGYPVRGHIVGIGFSDSAAITPLQAADLVAYTTMRWLAEGAYPETRDPWFPIVPAFLRMIEAIHADGGGYDREALSELIDKVKRGETAR